MAYIKPSANSVQSRERADCTVRALASASTMTYDECHAITAKFGRKPTHGMTVNDIIEMMKFVGAKHIGVFGTTIAANHIRRLTGAPEERGVELKNFLRYYQTGNYFCLCRGHAFAISNGQLMDHGYVKSGVAVISAWKF